MFSESSSAASYKSIARAKSPWADLLSASCVNCEEREPPMRSQPPAKPQMKMIDILAHATIVRRLNGETEYDKTDRRLSAHDIVANLLTCEPARTSILFLCGHCAFSFHCAFARGTFKRNDLFAQFCRY